MMKVPPHNLEAEQAVLCTLIIDPAWGNRVRKSLTPKDFYREAHQYLFDAIIHGNGDLTLIHSYLQEKGWLEKAGGKEYLQELAAVMATPSAAPYYIQIVKEASNKRKMVELAYNLIDRAERSSSLELSEFARKSLNALDIQDRFGYQTGVDLSNVYTPERCLQEYSEYIKTLKQNRFITGIYEIDKRIRGVAGGEVLFWIARAGSFKSAIIQNQLKRYAQHSAWGAVFFSIEMPIANVTERYHEIIHGSTSRAIEEIYVTAKDGASQIREALELKFNEELKGLYIVPTKVSISDVAHYVRLIEKYYKTKIGVIGIDYLGLMEGQGQGEYEIVSKLARDCKGLAKLLNLPVIVISQTSRKAGSGEVEISLDMGRGSGAIEESGDFVLGLFQVKRERLSTEDQEPDYDLICKILKNRKGPKGSRWQLDLDPTNLRIGPNAEPWEPPKKRRGNDL